MNIFLLIFFLCFAFLCWQRYYWMLSFFFFLLPAYLIRFDLFFLPTTLLEGMLFFLVLFWIAKKDRREKTMRTVRYLRKSHPWFLVAAGAFLLSATASVVFSVDYLKALGEWKAFYVEPVIAALLFMSISYERKKQVLLALMLSGLATGLLTLYQQLTGWMVPWDFWENGNSYRVTGWYGFPNGVAFYLALMFPLAMYTMHSWRGKWQSYLGLFTQILAVLGVIFAKSTGALIAIAGTMGVLMLLNKKSRPVAIGFGVIALAFLILAPWSNPIKHEVLMQDRSGQIRIAMWKEATKMLTSSPNKIIFGAGLASYKQQVEPFHTLVNGEGIEIFHHPHNQFLTFWSETGLLGLAGFVWMIVLFYQAFFTAKQSSFTYTGFVLLTIFLIMSLVDSPYIKNDTTILFWLIPALLYTKRHS